jgi:dTDP-4-dehydrorhamnose 3,5-epimerase
MPIHDVRIKELRAIPDERGRVMEILRCDDPIFEKFGQLYMTTVYPGVVKAWHFHKRQADNLTVVKGSLKLVLYDDRPDSPTRGQLMELFPAEHNPILVHVPPLVYHGFKGVGMEETIVVNCPTLPYDRNAPDEFRLDAHTTQIPYDWSRKDR